MNSLMIIESTFLIIQKKQHVLYKEHTVAWKLLEVSKQNTDNRVISLSIIINTISNIN